MARRARKPLLRDRASRTAAEIPWIACLSTGARLYGRSASDDKGPIVGILAALDALRPSAAVPA
jgi:acetylornithine deacetylase/succinyl-diaminopimelate desuccinylase-like protein